LISKTKFRARNFGQADAGEIGMSSTLPKKRLRRSTHNEDWVEAEAKDGLGGIGGIHSYLYSPTIFSLTSLYTYPWVQQMGRWHWKPPEATWRGIK
jgi:hypothetical protein